jgi:hypothetical protein
MADLQIGNFKVTGLLFCAYLMKVHHKYNFET